MFFLHNDQTVFFDCDETLVIWDCPEPYEERMFIENGHDVSAYVMPHLKHIEQLKKHKARGHAIVVWSAGGSSWAKAVVESLALTDFVDIVMCKPRWFYDDLKSEEFMPEINRVYYDPYKKQNE